MTRAICLICPELLSTLEKVCYYTINPDPPPHNIKYILQKEEKLNDKSEMMGA